MCETSKSATIRNRTNSFLPFITQQHKKISYALPSNKTLLHCTKILMCNVVGYNYTSFTVFYITLNHVLQAKTLRKVSKKLLFQSFILTLLNSLNYNKYINTFTKLRTLLHSNVILRVLQHLA